MSHPRRDGNPQFLFTEIGAVVLSSAWAFGFTYAMLWLIDRVTAVRVDPATEELGLDAGLHHEEAYIGIG